MRRSWSAGSFVAFRYAAPVGCVLVAAAVAVGWSMSRGPVEAEPRPAATGMSDVSDIYLRDCAVCHGPQGEGTPRGRDLAGSGPALVDYVLRTGRMPIDAPDEEIARSEPAYDEDTIAELVDYVVGLQDGAVGDGPAIPDVDPEAGDVAAGGRIWSQECAACHAWSGGGGAMARRTAPDVRHASPLEVAESVRSGPMEMPRFGEETIDREELDSLVAFMEDELKSPQNPGGWSLGHVGPVTEGAVALAIGLVILGVAARMIGAGRERR